MAKKYIFDGIHQKSLWKRMYCILFVCQIAFNEWNEKLHKQGTKYLKSFNEQKPSFVLFVEYNLSNNESSQFILLIFFMENTFAYVRV